MGDAEVRRLLAPLDNHEPPLLGSAKLRRDARRRAAALTVLALFAGAAAAAILGAADIGERLTKGRPGWITLAAGLELLSALGFVATFQLVFGEWLPERMSLRLGLAVRAATILIPAGGLVAIGLAAKALHRRRIPVAKTRSRAIAFLLITNAPNLIVLALFGIALGAGLLAGRRAPNLTILPAVTALAVIGLTMLLPTVSHQRAARVPHGIAGRVASVVVAQLELAVIEALALLRGRIWMLAGALAYYAFDNAVLWATFKAFGHANPPIATLVMAYLIGSVAGSLPVPAGIGVVEGGMIGSFVLYGAPVICAGAAVLAYRAVSTGLPLALGGAAVLTVGRPASRGWPLSARRVRRRSA
jgi:uncharacterized membrane protein YbhN (UPF0104 family)